MIRDAEEPKSCIKNKPKQTNNKISLKRFWYELYDLKRMLVQLRLWNYRVQKEKLTCLSDSSMSCLSALLVIGSSSCLLLCDWCLKLRPRWDFWVPAASQSFLRAAYTASCKEMTRLLLTFHGKCNEFCSLQRVLHSPMSGWWSARSIDRMHPVSSTSAGLIPVKLHAKQTNTTAWLTRHTTFKKVQHFIDTTLNEPFLKRLNGSDTLKQQLIPP